MYTMPTIDNLVVLSIIFEAPIDDIIKVSDNRAPYKKEFEQWLEESQNSHIIIE